MTCHSDTPTPASMEAARAALCDCRERDWTKRVTTTGEPHESDCHYRIVTSSIEESVARALDAAMEEGMREAVRTLNEGKREERERLVVQHGDCCQGSDPACHGPNGCLLIQRMCRVHGGATALDAAEARGWKRGMEEAAGICRENEAHVHELRDGKAREKWSADTRETLTHDAEMWKLAWMSIENRLSERGEGGANG